MVVSSRRGKPSYFLATAKWLVGLVALTVLYHFITSPPRFHPDTAWEWVHLLSGYLGMFLPFVAFVGGVATHGFLSIRGIVARTGVVAVLSYGLLGFAAPIGEYQSRLSRGDEDMASFPFGPRTPRAMAAARSAVQANPPERYSFSVEHPMEAPPNWYTYLIQGLVSLGAFAILSAFLGRLVGALTTGLSPPVRRNSRWALGLACSLAFFLPLAWAGDWVRRDPSNSGVAAAWLPFVLPLVGLGVLMVLIRLREGRLHPPDGPAV